ncbi:unnamed protein product [Cuscuta campestris]|uniref:F-box domain-containing protein n=1 Tax=Cuscuta campestris TaxID=132261 RepID=A0A484NLL9_9ASTE|nr:unnamed protein product [Cuscuta campestris]
MNFDGKKAEVEDYVQSNLKDHSNLMETSPEEHEVPQSTPLEAEQENTKLKQEEGSTCNVAEKSVESEASGDSEANDDEVVREIDVFLKPSIDSNTKLYVLQYPLRPKWRPYDLDEKCEEVRVKPMSSEFEVDLRVDTDSENYDSDAAPGVKMTKQTLSTAWKPTPSSTGYAVGVLVDNKDVHSTVRGHISQLPDEVLECILNKLKHRDAVRASLVSCRWRHLVLSRARLVFDLPSMFEMENCGLKGASGRKCVCLEYKDRFVQAVNQFIASYRGTHINEFVVCFCLKRDSASAVLNWIRFALDLGVQLLEVQLCGEHCKAKVPLCGTRCEIPLKHLLPSNRDAGETFILRPFSQLKALIFHRICLKSHCMETLLSSLVNLKQLEMKQCQLPSYLNLNSLTSLEGVSVFYCTMLEKIDVASLQLKSLNVLCRRIVSLELSGVPNLEELCYSVHGGSIMHHIFLKLPGLLPRLRTLRVDSSSSNRIEHMPESVTTFSRLRTLMLLALDPQVGDMMPQTVQLLKSCPLLCHLSTWLCVREDKEPEKLESVVEYHHECLEWISIHGFVGTKYQIESCKYLLKLAPRVKRLGLRRALPDLLSRLKVGRRRHVLGEEGCERALNALKAFSNDVKVFFF